jgi:Holliday junction resolvase-like predicted endonuclease
MGTFRHESEKEIYHYLLNNHYIILEHNKIFYQDNIKIEIDIIAYHKVFHSLHFIEVKNWEFNPYIHPVINEIKKRKEKLILSYNLFIKDIINNNEYYKNKCEYNLLLCLLNEISPWELSIFFDLIWKKKNKIYHFKNILNAL